MQKKKSPAKSSITREEQKKAKDKETIAKRKHIIEKWLYLKAQGISDKEISQILQYSRSGYFEIKKRYLAQGEKGLIKKSTRPHNTRKKKPIPQELRQRVYELRMEYPTYGHSKIYHLIKNEKPSYEFSERMVNATLKALMERGVIQVSISYRPKKSRRKFEESHARPWKYDDTKNLKPGEMVQIDHMTQGNNKVFRAVDPVTKFMATKAYTNATSLCAADFLHYVKERMPFTIVSIQVDGGSEFMGDFDSLCYKMKIPLYVLPPKSPKYNGCVERANGIMRDEFYACYDIPQTLEEHNALIQRFENHYNKIRPHSSLKGLSPLEYHNLISKHPNAA